MGGRDTTRTTMNSFDRERQRQRMDRDRSQRERERTGFTEDTPQHPSHTSHSSHTSQQTRQSKRHQSQQFRDHSRGALTPTTEESDFATREEVQRVSDLLHQLQGQMHNLQFQIDNLKYENRKLKDQISTSMSVTNSHAASRTITHEINRRGISTSRHQSRQGSRQVSPPPPNDISDPSNSDQSYGIRNQREGQQQRSNNFDYRDRNNNNNNNNNVNNNGFNEMTQRRGGGNNIGRKRKNMFNDNRNEMNDDMNNINDMDNNEGISSGMNNRMDRMGGGGIGNRKEIEKKHRRRPSGYGAASFDDDIDDGYDDINSNFNDNQKNPFNGSSIPNDHHDGRDMSSMRSGRDGRDIRDIRDIRDSRDPRDGGDGRDGRGMGGMNGMNMGGMNGMSNQSDANDTDIDMSAPNHNDDDNMQNNMMRQQRSNNNNNMNNMNNMNSNNNNNNNRMNRNLNEINVMNDMRNESDEEQDTMPARSDPQMLLSKLGPEAFEEVTERRPCPQCGRKFTEEALTKHMKICSKVFGKKRKTFDMSKQRLDEEAKKASRNNNSGNNSETLRNKAAAAAKKAKWKNQSASLREAIQASRMTEKMLKEGKSLKDIPVMQSSQPDNRVPCPYCGRKFSEEAAERHIPKCKNIKARPKPMKKPRKY